MGGQLMEIGFGLGKGVIYGIRLCLRLVCSHPFVFGFLSFMVFLYRTFPLIFSLLVSASPILVCTAVLLGILLSYGQPMVLEIEMGGEGIQLNDDGIGGVNRDLGEVKVKLDNDRAGDGEVVENHFASNVEVVDDVAWVIEERLEGIRMTANGIGGVSRDLGELSGEVKVKPNEEKVENHFLPIAKALDDAARVIEESLEEIRMSDGGIHVGELRGEMKMKQDDERVGVGEVVEEDEKCSSNDDVDSFDSEKVNVDSLDSPPRSPWVRAAEREVDEEGKDEEGVSGSDSGSDQDESLSPDASMEDIMPILDELHPLLDEEVHHGIHVSHDKSDAASERSLTSGTGTTRESDDEIEDHMDSDVANAENGDGEEEDGQGDEEELLKSATTWTEEDQKNLMDLRSSEIERNQRLENLIMRRKGRSLYLDEKAENHDDIDDNEDEEDGQEDKEEETKSAITWTEEDQKNLMDLGWSEIERNRRLENLILRRRAKKNMSMLPERNLVGLESFDLPFNIAPISTRRQNPFDLPHDFDDGSKLPPVPGSAPSVLLPRRNPFDIPYDCGEEKPNLLGDEFQKEFTAPRLRESFFLRQETFDVRPSRFARQDVKMRPYFVPEHTFTEESSSSQFQRQSSELSDSKVSSVPDSESSSSHEDLEERKLAEEGETEEIDEISKAKEVAEENLSGNPEPIFHPEVIEGYLESVPEQIRHDKQSSEGEDSSESDEHEVSEIQFQSHDAEDHTTRHVEVRATTYHLDSEAAELRGSRDSSSPSLSELSERAFMEAVDEGMSILEIIRDSAAEEGGVTAQPSLGSNDLITMSTVVTVILDRAPVYDLSPEEIRENLSSSPITSNVNRESDLGSPYLLVKLASEGTDWNIGMSTPSNYEMLPGSSSLDLLDKSMPKDVPDISDHAIVSTDLSGFGLRFESEGLLASSVLTSHVPIQLESLVEASAEGHLREQHTQAPISSADESIHSRVDHYKDQSLEDKHSLVSKANNLVDVTKPTFEGHLPVEQSFGMDWAASLPDSDAVVHHEIEEKSITALSTDHHMPMDEPNSEHISVLASSAPFHLLDDVTISKKQTYLKSKSDITVPHQMSALDLASSPSGAFETTESHLDRQATVGKIGEIKEIEVLLLELDNIGDFSSNQWGCGSSEFQDIHSVGKRFPSVEHSQASARSATEDNSVKKHNFDASMHSEFWTEETQVPLVPKFLEGDTEVSHQNINSREIEKPVALEASQTDAIVMAITGHSEERIVHPNPSVTSPAHKASFSEVGPFEDTALHYKQGNDGSTQKLELLNSVNRVVPVVEPGKTQGSELDLHVTSSVLSDDSALPIRQFPDGNEKQLKINLDDGVSKTKRDKIDSSIELSIVKDVCALTPEKVEHEVHAPKDLHSTVSQKE